MWQGGNRFFSLTIPLHTAFTRARLLEASGSTHVQPRSILNNNVLPSDPIVSAMSYQGLLIKKSQLFQPFARVFNKIILFSGLLLPMAGLLLTTGFIWNYLIWTGFICKRPATTKGFNHNMCKILLVIMGFLLR